MRVLFVWRKDHHAQDKCKIPDMWGAFRVNFDPNQNPQVGFNDPNLGQKTHKKFEISNSEIYQTPFIAPTFGKVKGTMHTTRMDNVNGVRSSTIPISRFSKQKFDMENQIEIEIFILEKLIFEKGHRRPTRVCYFWRALVILDLVPFDCTFMVENFAVDDIITLFCPIAPRLEYNISFLSLKFSLFTRRITFDCLSIQ